MKGYAMLKIGESGWIEKERPKCGPMDAICRPLAVAICTSDVHTLWEGAIGDRHNMILGHECCAEVVEVGELVKDFKPGDRVLVPAITPDWNSLEAQAGYSMHSGGMLAGWKFSNFKDGVFSEFFHVNDADGNLALLPKNINVVDACMLSDMVPTGFHGVELADVQFGDTVPFIGSWKTRPKKAARLYSGRRVTSFPSITMAPVSMGQTPAIAFNSVDFPAPFPPITVTKSPSFKVRLTPRRAFFSFTVPLLKVFVIFLISSMFSYPLFPIFEK